MSTDDIINEELETPDEVQEQEIEVLDAPSQDDKLSDAINLYQRTLAEFDNYRKRTSKEMAIRYDDGIRAACEDLLPLVDNFARALSACEDKENGFYQGVAMIARQLEGILTNLGLEAITLNPGDKFDPNFHNAVAHVEDENFGQNEIVDVLQKGYIHKGKVLRHSVVRVAN